MKTRALNIRGTSGTGKTHIVRALMKMTSAAPAYLNGGEFDHLTKKPMKAEKILAYEGMYEDLPIAFLGPYETACGGCDGIPSVHVVAALLDEYFGFFQEKGGLIIYEGLMISHMLGTVGSNVAKWGKENTVMAFLDTPLEVCLRRINERRRAAGRDSDVNPDNTTKDWDRVRSCMANARKQEFRVAEVPFERATQVCEGILYDLYKEIMS